MKYLAAFTALFSQHTYLVLVELAPKVLENAVDWTLTNIIENDNHYLEEQED